MTPDAGCPVGKLPVNGAGLSRLASVRWAGKSLQWTLALASSLVAQYCRRAAERRRVLQRRERGRRHARFVRGRPIYPHAQVVPRRLAGDRVGIGMRISAVWRQELRDQMIEQKTCAELRRCGVEVPSAPA